MLSQTLRRAFIKYFSERCGHKYLPSSPVIPHNDPTLLFCNAGMNQFKDIFLGNEKPAYKRAVTSQKCVRVGGKHNDLEQVGHTTRHLTFFEMLGNFSFGDYFKKEAIAFAWECATEVLELDPKKIWVTVFREDDEAEDLWTKWLPQDRICRFDEEDNYWTMGDVGPCGPCSELYFDRGESFGPAKTPFEDPEGERFFEFWNLVFMQDERRANGSKQALPSPSIDTGMGLERLVALKMGARTVFETDILDSLRRQLAKMVGQTFPEQAAAPYNVVADHLRTLAFCIADGAQPSNVERGYVLRKILRRAVRYGRQIGFDKPFLGELVPPLVEMMGEDFPELAKSQQRIIEILNLEEESFLRTLRRGGSLLQDVMTRAKQEEGTIAGQDAFKLKDTYGFPLEEILLIAHDEGMAVDLESYTQLENEAKERSRAHRGSVAQTVASGLYENAPKTEFLGNSLLCAEGEVLAIFQDGKSVSTLREGESGEVILDKTPFYAEKGGQVGDVGLLQAEETTLFRVSDCQSPYTDVIVHHGTLEKGRLSIGQTIVAEVGKQRRRKIACHHSATHLLHWALQKVLGDHVQQAGSVVEPNRLRFDFNHHKSLSADEIRQIEDCVNKRILKNTTVECYELSYEEVQQQPEIKQFFGDKYGDVVRVVDMHVSKELCGGTHVQALGQIGPFKILKEGSISSGVRRIEACVGFDAINEWRKSEEALEKATEQLKVQPGQVLSRIEELLAEKKSMQKELKKLAKVQAQMEIKQLELKKQAIGPVSVLVSEVPFGGKELRECAKELVGNDRKLLLLLSHSEGERCQLLAAAGPEAIEKGAEANELLQVALPIVEGRGGGKADFAQAGGSAPQKMNEAFEAVNHWVSNKQWL